MKTIEEFVKEINRSKELQKAFGEIKDQASLEAFLKEHGCDATADEFAKFVQSNSEGEISDEAAQGVAGGFSFQLPPISLNSNVPGPFINTNDLQKL